MLLLLPGHPHLILLKTQSVEARGVCNGLGWALRDRREERGVGNHWSLFDVLNSTNINNKNDTDAHTGRGIDVDQGAVVISPGTRRGSHRLGVRAARSATVPAEKGGADGQSDLRVTADQTSPHPVWSGLHYCTALRKGP